MNELDALLMNDLLDGIAWSQALGRELDYLRAAAHFSRAAKSGSRFAQDQLAELVAKGVFSELDLKKSVSELPKTHDLVYGKQTQSAGHNQTTTLVSTRSSAKEESPQQGKILLVEDGEETRTLIAYMLTKSGFQPITAADGIDALEQTLLHPDVICMLIDLQMPQMNGFEFIATLRKEQAFKSIPIIVITAYTNPSLMEQGRKLGVKGWIKKPIRKDLLLGTINKSLRESA